MTRAFRRLVARCVVVALAASQLITAAHACGSGPQAPTGHRPAGIVGAAATSDHCRGHVSAASLPPANVCHAHCNDGAMRTPSHDLPAMAAVPVLIAATTLALPYGTERSPAVSFLTPGGAPPPILQFCRLLN
jgi:hypothetical protein